MDKELIRKWSIKIAEVTEPNEVSIAGKIGIAFAKGGKHYKSLFEISDENDIGGDGIGDFVRTILPDVLNAILFSGGIIITIIKSQDFVNILTSIKEIINLKESISNSTLKSKFSQNENLYKIIQIMDEVLKEHIKDENKRNRIILKVIKNLLVLKNENEEEAESVQFINELSKNNKKIVAKKNKKVTKLK